MKLKFLLWIILFAFNTAIVKANKWTVTVANFQFSPANINVSVGDTILWTWTNGGHTTTSTAVPAGAATWDSQMNSSHTTFQYVVSVAGTYNYWCTIHAPSMAGSITASAVLPVTLSSFMISAGVNNSALLKWSTASEENTKWFIIKKSTDGASYKEITRIPAAGNSSLLRYYSYNDNHTGNVYKYIYYELQIINTDGSFAFSPVQKFINNNAVKKLITQVSPNPVSAGEHLMFQFNADKQGVMLVEIYDANGKRILQTSMGAESGLNNGHLHLMNAAAGIYNAVFSMEGMKESYRLVIIR